MCTARRLVIIRIVSLVQLLDGKLFDLAEGEVGKIAYMVWSDASTVLRKGSHHALLQMRMRRVAKPWDVRNCAAMKWSLERPCYMIQAAGFPDTREAVELSCHLNAIQVMAC